MAGITQNGSLRRDDNDSPVMGGTSSADNATIINAAFDPVTRRLLMDSAGGGSGTVTSVSVVTANGFAGTVATATTTPAITLTTTVTGILSGNGTAISAASTTGSGAVVLATSPTLVTPALGTPTALVGTNITGTGAGFTSGSTNALQSATTTVNVSSATAPTNGQVLTATSGTAATWQTPATGSGTVNSGTAGQLTYYASTGTTVSGNANLTVSSSALTIGVAGSAVGTLLFANATSGTITLSPVAGALGSSVLTLPAATDTVAVLAASQAFTNKTYNGLTISSSTGTLAIANGKTLTQSNSLTYTGTDGSTVAFGTGGTVLYTASVIPLTVGTTTIASGTTTRILYDNAGVLGEYTLTGTGTVVAMQTAPTFVTSATVPLLIGGSGTTGTQLTLKTTTGNGTTDALVIAGGNNGGTTFATFSAALLALATGSITMTGSLAATGARVTKGWFTDIESTNVPTVGGTALPTATSTTTFTNKRMTRRATTVNAPGASPTTVTDNVDIQIFTGLATAITSMTTNLSGTPNNGDMVEFQFVDNGTARAITWGSSFVNGGLVNLPSTTVINTMLRVLVEWQTTTSTAPVTSTNKWVCIAVA